MGGARDLAPLDYFALRKALPALIWPTMATRATLRLRPGPKGAPIYAPPNPFDPPTFYGLKPVRKEKFFPSCSDAAGGGKKTDGIRNIELALAHHPQN